MKPSALIERYRMALEVIATGSSFEPGTKVAKIALSDPWVVEPVSMEAFNAAVAVEAKRLSVNEAVEQARAEEMAHETTDDDLAEWEETQEPDEEPDDDPEPVDMAEIDRELDEEDAEEEAEKPSRVREKVGDDGLTDTQRAILEFIRERGEASPAMIRGAVETTHDKHRRALALLRERGLIEPDGGHTSTRTYKPARLQAMNTPTIPDPAPKEAAGQELKPLRKVPAAPAEKPTGTDEGRVLESVRFKPGWSIAQHASRLDLHTDRVAVAIRKLEREAEVRAEARNGRVVWRVA